METMQIQELELLSKHQIEEISKKIRQFYKLKYDNKHHEPYYGELPRAMTKEEIFTFFKSPLLTSNLRNAYLIQFFYGLRQSELYDIEVIKEFNIIKIHDQKMGRYEMLPIHGPTIKLFEKLGEIERYSKAYIRVKFGKIIKEQSYDYIYHKDERGQPRHLISNHSLRHTAITIFGDYIKDPIKVIKFGRWKKRNTSYGTMPIYRTYRIEELREDLEKAFKEYYELINFKY